MSEEDLMSTVLSLFNGLEKDTTMNDEEKFLEGMEHEYAKDLWEGGLSSRFHMYEKQGFSKYFLLARGVFKSLGY